MGAVRTQVNRISTKQTQAERCRCSQWLLCALACHLFTHVSLPPPHPGLPPTRLLGLLPTVPSGCRSWRETEQFQGDWCENGAFNQRGLEKMACSVLSRLLWPRRVLGHTWPLWPDRSHKYTPKELVVAGEQNCCPLSFSGRVNCWLWMVMVHHDAT